MSLVSWKENVKKCKLFCVSAVSSSKTTQTSLCEGTLRPYVDKGLSKAQVSFWRKMYPFDARSIHGDARQSLEEPCSSACFLVPRHDAFSVQRMFYEGRLQFAGERPLDLKGNCCSLKGIVPAKGRPHFRLFKWCTVQLPSQTQTYCSFTILS